MKQNRFFSAVYIIGTGLAISMVMVMAVVYHIRTANIAPEVNRDRMCYVTNVSFNMNDDKGHLNSCVGPRFAKEVMYNLKTPEAVAVATMTQMMPFTVGDVFMQAPGHDEAPKVSFGEFMPLRLRRGDPLRRPISSPVCRVPCLRSR